MKHRPDEILDAATSLFAAEGVGVSTSRIATAAAVSNGTLFNYFPTKQDLLDALYLRIKGELGAAFGTVDPDAPLREQSRLIWDRWHAWAVANPERHRVGRLLHEAGLITESAAVVVEAMFATPIAFMHRLAESGTMAPLPIDHVAALTQAHLDLAIQAGLTGSDLDTAFEVMWNAITTPIPTPTP